MVDLNKSLDSDKLQEDIILVINCGSSTVKYQLLNMATQQLLLKGVFEGLCQEQGQHSYTWFTHNGLQQQNTISLISPDYPACFDALADIISENKYPRPTAIGHRVVHGGEVFTGPALIEASILAKIEQLSVLAPLHNPVNLEGIRLCLALYPHVPQVAVFDTAFHQTMPDYVYRYPISASWYSEHHIRKYGFHGTSHQYVAQQAADYLQTPLATLNLITVHLGNGASIAAIEQGQCIDTSMGFTPLEGLMMGTRCGDIDPAIPLYMQKATGLNATQVSDELNHHSGLLAVAGEQDMRDVLLRSNNGEPTAELAIKMYCYRIKKYIGAFLAAIGHVDAIIFTGGIGENSAVIRSRCCDGLELLGIKIDFDLNEPPNGSSVSLISCDTGNIKVLAVKTNEELQIANEVVNYIKSGKARQV